MTNFNSVSVGTTPVEVAAANGMRRSLLIINRGFADIYLGNSSSVSPSSGSIMLRPNENYSANGDWGAYWAVAASGSQQVDVAEAS